MISTRKAIALMLVVLAARSLANLPESPGEYSKWETQMLSAISDQKNRPPEEAIPKLGGWIMQMSIPANLEQGSRPVFHASQAALLTIPGHAEYYRDRIFWAQERFKNPGGGTTWSEYRVEIKDGFQIFPHLNSPEGVRVLGELMYNDWVPTGNESAPISEKFVPLSVSARVALAQFPLINKPFTDPVTQNNRDDALAAWRNWYEHIKSGKRTFRFDGDPIEYDLYGPAAKQKQERIARDHKRDSEREAGLKKTAESSAVVDSTTASASSRSMPVAILIAGIGLLVSLAWYFMGRSKSSS